MQTAQALYDKAADQQNAGLSPAIDTLRARVEFQNRQQQLIVARNDYAKQKLALVRAIGLPVGQEIALTSKAPYDALATPGIEESLQRAYASRSDYLAAVQQVRAAEHYRKGASAEYFPTIDVTADYGDLGVNFGNSHGTFTVAGRLNIPIFQGGKVHADVLQADATLRQTRAQLDNLRGQIEYEVRTALLDIDGRRRAGAGRAQFRRSGGTNSYPGPRPIFRRRYRQPGSGPGAADRGRRPMKAIFPACTLTIWPRSNWSAPWDTRNRA